MTTRIAAGQQVDGHDQNELSPDALAQRLAKEIPAFRQLPEKDRRIIAHTMVEQTFSGPLPPPQQLQGYEDTCPGAAQAILKMATDDLAHTHAMQQKAFDEDARRFRFNFCYKLLGLMFGLVACMSFLSVAALMVWRGHPIEGGIFGSSVAGIAGVFIWGARKRPKPEQSNAQPKRLPAKNRRK